MALDAKKLGEAIKDTFPTQEDGEGNPLEVPKETQAYADGLIAAIKASVVAFLPGGVTGLVAPGAPLNAGGAMAGSILITPAPMIAATAATLIGPNAQAEHTAIISYLATGLVTFSTGQVTGTCTNTPTTPGPLAAGGAEGGKINGLTGAGAAAMVLSALGSTGPEAVDLYGAIMDYITQNAEVSFKTGSIVGVCPPASGPLTAGAGAGGIIS